MTPYNFFFFTPYNFNKALSAFFTYSIGVDTQLSYHTSEPCPFGILPFFSLILTFFDNFFDNNSNTGALQKEFIRILFLEGDDGFKKSLFKDP